MPDKFPSKYSNGKVVTAAQYITEIICERKAVSDGLDLHYRFWLQPKWSAFYRNQIASAHKLLAKHDAMAIVKALQTTQGKKIYSLRAPHLPAIIEQQKKILDQKNNTLTQDIQRKSEIVFQQNNQTKSIISKLKDLDNES